MEDKNLEKILANEKSVKRLGFSDKIYLGLKNTSYLGKAGVGLSAFAGSFFEAMAVANYGIDIVGSAMACTAGILFWAMGADIVRDAYYRAKVRVLEDNS